MNPVALMRVMYAPLAYAHTEHRTLAGTALERLPASVANQLLIDHHSLDTRIEFDLHADEDAQRCIERWNALPRVCFLMGAHRLRAALIEQGRYPRLDRLCQQFLCLPLPAAPAVPGMAMPDDFTLLGCGAQCAAPVFRRLPRPVRQRVPLLFSKTLWPRLDALMNGNHTADGPRWHPSLFSFAMTYAQLEPSALP